MMIRFFCKTMFFLVCAFVSSASLGSDMLHIIELSGPGQTIPVNIPAGNAFKFSLFTGNSSSNDAAVGVVSYASPANCTFEQKHMSLPTNHYQGWFIGPAQVSLKSAVTGKSRMQLYINKLPAGSISGILSETSPQYSITIPSNSLLTSYFTFDRKFETISSFAPSFRKFYHDLSIKTPDGNTFCNSYLKDQYSTTVTGPCRSSGYTSIYNIETQSSDVVKSFWSEGLDYVSPTDDFCGPGTATFSLPPKSERSTTIAFYCYRITSTNVIGVDATPPTLSITTPLSLSATTTLSNFSIKGSTSDNISAIRILFRIKPPSAAYGSWQETALIGSNTNKTWEKSVALSTKGLWTIQVQVFDKQNNPSEIQTVTLTKK